MNFLLGPGLFSGVMLVSGRVYKILKFGTFLLSVFLVLLLDLTSDKPHLDIKSYLCQKIEPRKHTDQTPFTRRGIWMSGAGCKQENYRITFLDLDVFDNVEAKMALEYPTWMSQEIWING